MCTKEDESAPGSWCQQKGLGRQDTVCDMRASPCWAKAFSFELAAGHVRVTSDPCISARRNGPEKAKECGNFERVQLCLR